MIRILLAAAALGVLSLLAPRTGARAGRRTDPGGSLHARLAGHGEPGRVARTRGRCCCACPWRDDLSAGVQGGLLLRRRGRRLRAAGPRRQRHLVVSGVLRHGQRQLRPADRHPGQPVHHADHDREGAERDPGQPVQARRRCLDRHRHARRRCAGRHHRGAGRRHRRVLAVAWPVWRHLAAKAA